MKFISVAHKQFPLSDNRNTSVYKYIQREASKKNQVCGKNGVNW